MNASAFIFYLRFVSVDPSSLEPGASLLDPTNAREHVATWSFLTGVVGLVTQLAAAAFLKWWCGRPGGGYWHTPTPWVLGGKLACGVLMPAIMLTSRSAEAFVATYVVERLAYSPVTFWMAVNKGLCIDEDSMKVAGRRREGLFIGVQHMIQSFIGLLVIVYLGLLDSLAGLDTTKCYGERQPPVDLAKLFYWLDLTGAPDPAAAGRDRRSRIRERR